MKYLHLLQYELKNMLKDKMSMFMVLYPLIILAMMGIVLPLTARGLSQQELAASFPFVLVFVLCLGPMAGGMLMGFSILENKDEKTLNTIAVTPLSLRGYVLFKTVYCTVISLVGTLVLLYGIKVLAGPLYITFNPQTSMFVPMFELLSHLHIFAFSLVSALLTATFGLMLGGIAKNKVEGLVYMKIGGIVLILPALALLPAFAGGAQYALGVLPNFWAVKAMQNIVFFSQNTANLPFYAYLIVGVVYSLLLSAFSYKLFRKKVSGNI